MLTYREMMARYASLVALVTPVPLGMIQPLVEGLGTQMLVDAAGAAL